MCKIFPFDKIEYRIYFIAKGTKQKIPNKGGEEIQGIKITVRRKNK